MAGFLSHAPTRSFRLPAATSQSIRPTHPATNRRGGGRRTRYGRSGVVLAALPLVGAVLADGLLERSHGNLALDGGCAQSCRAKLSTARASVVLAALPLIRVALGRRLGERRHRDLALDGCCDDESISMGAVTSEPASFSRPFHSAAVPLLSASVYADTATLPLISAAPLECRLKTDERRTSVILAAVAGLVGALRRQRLLVRMQLHLALQLACQPRISRMKIIIQCGKPASFSRPWPALSSALLAARASSYACSGTDSAEIACIPRGGAPKPSCKTRRMRRTNQESVRQTATAFSSDMASWRDLHEN